MQVESVGLSQPFKLSVFSVDRSTFVDRPVENVAWLAIFELDLRWSTRDW
jgi:hypothetical protein